jgi:hypothetical protein
MQLHAAARNNEVVNTSVADLNPDPDPPDPLDRGMDSDPDPSITKQKQ